MKYQITQLTKTDGGAYNESGDILPDMLNGAEEPQTLDDVIDWLADDGFEKADGFAGWGAVMKHTETGELLSICER